jgi:soluble lytic murein transglycosylase-like protein
MDQNAKRGKLLLVALQVSLIQALSVFPSPSAHASHPLLKEIIVAHNQRLYGESLADGSYRGEEGLLRIRPEPAESLVFHVLIDRDYLEGTESLQRAERFLARAKAAMISQRRDKSLQEHAQQIFDSFLAYRKALEAGRQKLNVYRTKLNSQIDERLNDAMVSQVMDRLLTDSLKRASYKLREALALFYNQCHGLDQNDYPLSTVNVGFVNEVFRQFLFRAPKETLSLHDLDRCPEPGLRKNTSLWKQSLERQEARYMDLVLAATERTDLKGCTVDPLLFMALMKRESALDPYAVSRMGAAGLTQIMPQTALELGMKNIFKPAYFDKALQALEMERKTRSEAMATLFGIRPQDGLSAARRARELMQESLSYSHEKEKLLAQYRHDLLQNPQDSRFQPDLAIEYGFRYYSRLMKEHEGDISLALASYNAGLHKVREYHGIPPFGETVLFRNKVLEYYREYLKSVWPSRVFFTLPGEEVILLYPSKPDLLSILELVLNPLQLL